MAHHTEIIEFYAMLKTYQEREGDLDDVINTIRKYISAKPPQYKAVLKYINAPKNLESAEELFEFLTGMYYEDFEASM
jgi:hypothetical protein